MRFLFLTSPKAAAAPELFGHVQQRLSAVKVLSFTARPGREGVGTLEADSHFDAEDFARTIGREAGGAIRVLPL